MFAALANFVPSAFAVLDAVALLIVLVFTIRGLILAILARPAWKAVLIATTSYVLWANALQVFGLTAFNPGAYVIIVTDLGWRAVTGTASSQALPSALRRLLVSWAGVSLVPTLAVAAVGGAARRRAW